MEPFHELTRNFLDRLGDYSESLNRFPDISFGKTYVNITLRPQSDEESAELSSKDHDFASSIDQLIASEFSSSE